MAFNLGLGIVDDAGTLLASLLLCLCHDSLTGCGGLLEYYGLLLPCFLKHRVALLLDVLKLGSGLLRLGQALVDVLLALVYHDYDRREAELGEHEEHHKECQKHPKEESKVRSQY